MATPESKVKAAIKKWLHAHGYWRAGGDRPDGELRGWYFQPQNMGLGSNGVPDFVGSGIRNGCPVPWAIEAKAGSGQPTALQKERHEEMRAAGWLVLVVRDVSQLADLERYCHG